MQQISYQASFSAQRSTGHTHAISILATRYEYTDTLQVRSRDSSNSNLGELRLGRSRVAGIDDKFNTPATYVF